MSLLYEHGGSLLVGATVLLAAGCLLVACCRQPVHRQRMGEAVAVAVLGWLLLAPWPLPRVGLRAPAPAVRAAVTADLSLSRPAELPVVPAPPAALPRVSVATPDTGLRAEPLAPLPEPVAAVSWNEVLVRVWIAGAVGIALWLLAGALRLRGLVRRSAPAPDWLVGLAPVPPRVRVLVARGSVRPLCAGVLRPVVLLPQELCAPRHATLLRHVLRHELAHLSRGDCRTQWLCALLLPVLFFHPLLWWLRRQVRRAAEIVADEVAASQSDRAAYARELIALAEQKVPRARIVGGVAVFQNGSEFYRRMEMLLRRERPLSVSCSRFRCLLHLATAGLLIGAGAGLWGAPLAAQDPVRSELEELRAERDRLAREVEELRAMVQQRGWSDPFTPGPTWSMMEVEVEKGQTFRDVLGTYFTEVDDALIDRVRRLNPGLDQDRLRVGQKIRLPAGRSQTYYWNFGPYRFDEGESDPKYWRPGPTGQGVPGPRTGQTPVQDPLQGDTQTQKPGQPVLQDTYLTQPDIDAVRRAAGPYYRAAPGTGVVGIGHEPVLDLVTRVVELRGDVDIAIARLEELQEQGKSTRIAEVEVRTAQRKLHVVQQLVESELDASAMELDLVRQQIKRSKARKDDPEYMRLRVQAERLQMRMHTLRSAL